MKKYLLLLVAVMLASVVSAAVGDTFTYEGLNFKVISEDDHTAAVDRNESVSGDITIPSDVKRGESSYSVTTIGEQAFIFCSELTSVTIPNSVTEIGELAFCKCSNLSSVIIPNSVTTIGVQAFNFCAKLTSVTIPYSVTTIGHNAFSDCIELASVAIPNSVTKIEDYTFRNCSNLSSVVIPNSITEIGEFAFMNCSSLPSVTIPGSVTIIGTKAFCECHSLTSVTVPNSVTTIGKYAFSSCSNLTEIVIENGNPNYSSENGALLNVDKTTLIQCPGGKKGEYSIPNSVTTIGKYAFYECSKLTSVNIPNSVTTLEVFAFGYCTGLTSVTIPNSVTSIGEDAFYECNNMAEFIVKNGNPNYSSENGVLFDVDKRILLKYPHGKKGWYSIPNTVTTIGEYAFLDCDNLASITIPNSVTEIREGAFSGCSSIPFVTIPNSVTIIGYFAFSGCSSIMEFVVTNGNPNYSSENGVLFNVNKTTLLRCPERKTGEYTIPKSVTTIGSQAFYDCTDLTSVTIPASVTEIEGYAFWRCENLKTIYDMNPTPQPLGYYVFHEVPKDAVVYVPKESVKKYSEAKGWDYFTDFREMGASGIEEIETNADAPVDVYNLQGAAVLRGASASELSNLPAGIYIVRQGKNVKKVAVK